MFWADIIAKEIIETRGKRHVLATAITPSGPIHIGNMREVSVADITRRALEDLGAEVEFIYIADDFDPLRRVYPFLDKKRYESEVGKPLSKIPDPEGCHKSYAEHFIAPFFKALEEMDINPKKLSATKMYKEGKYTEFITIALKNKEKIKEIFEKISHRKLESDWSPFNPLCKKCGRINSAKLITENLIEHTVEFVCKCGEKSEADYSKGEGKLAWRVDWPSRWKMLGVSIEPFGKEHAAAGGSYDTAKVISKDIFDYPAPYGIFYEFLYLKGVSGKMSSSLGNVITAEEMLSFVLPSVLKFLLTKNKDRHIDFDPGKGLMQLVDEFSELEEAYRVKAEMTPDIRAYELSKISEQNARLPISFKHLTTTVQAAQGNIHEVVRILRRTGYPNIKPDDKALTSEVQKIKNWLAKYAPQDLKFEIKKELPPETKKISDKQKELLKLIAEKLETEEDPEVMHNFIYEEGKKLGMTPAETFEPIYLSILGKKYGPKAGWFLTLLDKDFVIKRFKEV